MLVYDCELWTEIESENEMTKIRSADLNGGETPTQARRRIADCRLEVRSPKR